LSPTGPGFSANAREGHFEPDQEIDLEAQWLIDICVPVAKTMGDKHIASRVFPVFPFAFGEGPRFFELMGVNSLKLLSTKTFTLGVVALHYQPQS
jgi:hypothetical protein